MAPRERTAWPPTWESVKPKPRNALWINYARGCDAVALQGEQGELLKSPTSNDQRKILKSFNERLRRLLWIVGSILVLVFIGLFGFALFPGRLSLHRRTVKEPPYWCPAKNSPRAPPSAALVKKAGNKYGYPRRQKRYSFEQFPKLVGRNSSSYRFILCTIPKNGCSQWKRLILKAMGFEPSFYLDRTTSHLTIHGTKYKYLPLIPKWRMTSALEDPDTPRVVISRNPFTRILSGYLNKIVSANDRHRYREQMGLDQWSDSITFEDFVVSLRRWAREQPDGLALSSGIDHHFALQTSFCGMPSDKQSFLHYDWILKMEQINDWYPCIVHQLGIQSIVDSGWPDKECFFSTPKRPCKGQSMEGGFSKTTWDARDHGTKSGESLRRHYNAALEGIVADLYAPDFEFFGYPTSLARSGPSDLGLSMGEPN